MIDYFFKFTSEAVAIADASGTIYYKPAAGGNPAAWNPDRVTPGIQVWRPSLDVTTYQVTGGNIVTPGSGGTNGAVTLTAVGGTGTAATATGTIAGGILTALTGIVNHGSYSVLPANPVAVTGAGLVGATVFLNTQAIVTHTYLPGWFGTISLDHIDATLVNHAALQIAIDRDLSAAGQVAIIKSNLGGILQDVMFSPVFAGSNYPFGALI